MKDCMLLGVPVEIQIDFISSKSQKHYCPSQLSWCYLALNDMKMVIHGEVGMPIFGYSGICRLRTRDH